MLLPHFFLLFHCFLILILFYFCNILFILSVFKRRKWLKPATRLKHVRFAYCLYAYCHLSYCHLSQRKSFRRRKSSRQQTQNCFWRWFATNVELILYGTINHFIDKPTEWCHQAACRLQPGDDHKSICPYDQNTIIEGIRDFCYLTIPSFRPLPFLCLSLSLKIGVVQFWYWCSSCCGRHFFDLLSLSSSSSHWKWWKASPYKLSTPQIFTNITHKNADWRIFLEPNIKAEKSQMGEKVTWLQNHTKEN